LTPMMPRTSRSRMKMRSTLVPKPFARVHVEVGAPLHVARAAGDADRESLRLRVGAVLDHLSMAVGATNDLL